MKLFSSLLKMVKNIENKFIQLVDGFVKKENLDQFYKRIKCRKLSLLKYFCKSIFKNN